jgi:hypothetical protein
MTSALEMLRERVRVARLREAEASARWREIQAGIETAHADVLALRQEAAGELADAEHALRAAAEAHYRETGAKAPVEGVSIRESVVLRYAEADALLWAKATMPGLVVTRLDVKAFEKVAKAAPSEVPFVAVETVGKAALASELPALAEPAAGVEVPF